MTDCNFCMLENGVLNWQTSYVWFMAQFKRNRKIICNHTVLLCLYMADPATFQASNSIPSSKNSLRVHLLERYIFPNLYYDLSDILSWNFFSKPAQCGNCSLFSFFLFCVLYSTRRKKSRQNKGGVCYMFILSFCLWFVKALSQTPVMDTVWIFYEGFVSVLWNKTLLSSSNTPNRALRTTHRRLHTETDTVWVNNIVKI